MPEQVQYLAVGGGIPHYALLRDAAINQWEAVQEALRAKWKSSEQSDVRRRVADLSGCLEKLSASLLQAHRIRNHHDDLLCQAKALKPTGANSAAMRGANACADFEALLLQGRAALDRLAWHVTSQFKNPSQSFRKIKNVLAGFVNRSDEARELIEIIEKADTWFDGTFGKLDAPRSLRDLVAHHHALIEGVRTCFGINRVTQNSVLLIDCEIQLPGLNLPIPVLTTANETVKWLAYIVLNVVAILTKVPRLQPDAYESRWHNRTIAISRFVIDEPAGSPLGPYILHSVRTMTLDGFVFGTDNVNPSIFECAVEI
jgi:hypothetical protein